MTAWEPDVLGPDYERLTLPLGTDPDGEGEVVATLVRHVPSTTSDALRAGTGALLHVHGYTDYFFQTGLAERVAAGGRGFYALDLRRCGRSLRPGQTPHYCTDLARYDAELDRALALVTEALTASGGPVSVVVEAHSTGGLVTPLWLDRRRRAGLPPVAGLVLNSPWFDLQGAPWLRSVGTLAVDAVGRLAPRRVLPTAVADAYGASLHASRQGEWDYDLDWKPLLGVAVRAGWLRAVRRGHAQLHRGLDVGCPSLVLRSDRSVLATSWREEVDAGDAVLDVAQIARWAGCLGGRTTVVPVPGARHDVFLSTAGRREAAMTELDAWLGELDHVRDVTY
ncbi:alpha/beta hydrolase [Rhodococcus aerolatus]